MSSATIRTRAGIFQFERLSDSEALALTAIGLLTAFMATLGNVSQPPGQLEMTLLDGILQGKALEFRPSPKRRLPWWIWIPPLICVVPFVIWRSRRAAELTGSIDGSLLPVDFFMAYRLELPAFARGVSLYLSADSTALEFRLPASIVFGGEKRDWLTLAARWSGPEIPAL